MPMFPTNETEIHREPTVPELKAKIRRLQQKNASRKSALKQLQRAYIGLKYQNCVLVQKVDDLKREAKKSWLTKITEKFRPIVHGEI